MMSAAAKSLNLHADAVRAGTISARSRRRTKARAEHYIPKYRNASAPSSLRLRGFAGLASSPCWLGEPLSNEKESETLFRQVALEAVTARWGTPVKPLGVASWSVTLFLVALLAVVAAFLAIGTFARKETVVGLLQPASGSAKVVGTRTGIIEQVHVREGQFVMAGAPIVTLTSETRLFPQNGSGPSLGESLQALTTTQMTAVADAQDAIRSRYRVQRHSLEAKAEALASENDRLTAERGIQIDRIRLAEETFEAGQNLNARGLFSTLQLRQRQEALLASRQALSSYDREIARVGSEATQANIERRRLEAEELQAIADIRRTQAELSEREITLSGERRVVVTAEKAGRISALQARPGIATTPGATLALILPPQGGLVAELWVPSRAIGFVVPGSRVRLMYEAFPFQKFGVGHGIITQVSAAATDPADLPSALGTEEPLYKVTVKLDRQAIEAYEKQWPLAAGMRLSADIILERRSFIDWMLDPLLAVARRS